jgi:phage terminase large subunit-like protein
MRDLERTDVQLDAAAVDAAFAFFERLPLVGEDTGRPFVLTPWQRFWVGNLVGWRAADGRRRFKLAILQVARGNGKTTLAAGLGLWDMEQGDGRRVHVIANNEDQAGICLDTARTMARAVGDPSTVVRFDRVLRPSHDCEFNALPALERSLDGLNPSLWIADEAAEFKGRFLTKLLTTGAKRRESLGVIISTPGSNPENHYAELVKQAEAVLSGEVEDDTMFPMLYGIDQGDAVGDEEHWPKANPGMEHGQPDMVSLRRSWNTMKRSAMGRSEFTRYHCARADEK